MVAGIGRQKLRRHSLMKQSMKDLLVQNTYARVIRCLCSNDGSSSLSLLAGKQSYNSACAAAGQLGLMSLYETMFDQYDILASQMLLTSQDFDSHDRRRNMQVFKLCGLFPCFNLVACVV